MSRIEKSDLYREYLRLKRNVDTFRSLQMLLDNFPAQGVDPNEKFIPGTVDAVEDIINQLIQLQDEYHHIAFTDPDIGHFVQVMFEVPAGITHVADDLPVGLILDIPDLMYTDPGYPVLRDRCKDIGLERKDKAYTFQVEICDEPGLYAELVLFCLNEVYSRNSKHLIHVEVG